MFSLAKYWSHLRLVDEILEEYYAKYCAELTLSAFFGRIHSSLMVRHLVNMKGKRKSTNWLSRYTPHTPPIHSRVCSSVPCWAAPSTRSCVSGKKSPLLLKTKRLPDSCDETARRRSKGATIDAPKKRQQGISQCSLDQSDKARILKVFHHFKTKSALQLRSLIPAKISTQSQLAQLVLL